MSASKLKGEIDAPASRGPVVVVDDVHADAMRAAHAVEELRPWFPVQILTSGEELASYLDGQGLYQDRCLYPYPGLILLDLKMPRMDGFETLQWIKDNPKHSKIPVVVLSGVSGMAAQVTQAYKLGAHSFLPKPIREEDVESILSVLKINI
jgi:two-component system response regulator